MSLLQRINKLFGKKPVVAEAPLVAQPVAVLPPVATTPAGAVYDAIDIYTLMTTDVARKAWSNFPPSQLTDYMSSLPQASITREFDNHNDDFKPSHDRLVCIYGRGRFHISHETYWGTVRTEDGPKDNFMCLASIDGVFQNGKAYAKTTVLVNYFDATETTDTLPSHLEAVKTLREQADLHPLAPVHYEPPLNSASRKTVAHTL